MSEAAFIQYFRSLPTHFSRNCKLLVAARPDEEVVGYWGGRDATSSLPNILAFNLALVPNTNDQSMWITLRGRGAEARAEAQTAMPPIENAQPLAGIDATSYPNLEEEWQSVAPAGYTAWLSAASPESREPVIAALQEYENFYRTHYPYSIADRDVYAVIGGWGLYIYEGEWGDYPESEHIAFTLADAEPYYAVRKLPDGRLISKSIIT